MRAKKALGQHFLNDKALLNKICAAVGSLQRVLEIGAGSGSLTEALLINGAENVVALEKDERCIPLLGKLAEQYPGRLRVEQGNARHFLLAESGLSPPFQVVGNLPYHIASGLILGWLPQASAVESFCLLLQKEVAERLTARVGDISGFSVVAQRVVSAELLFEIGPEYFSPRPRVTSALARLIPRPAPYAANATAELDLLLRAAFGRRRKMLANSLKELPAGLEALLQQGVTATARPEEVSPLLWFRAAETLAQMRARDRE